MIRFLFKISLACGFLLPFGGTLLADGGGHGRSARLTPPDGAPFPEARGEVVLNKNHLIVNVEGLGIGDYSVLLDDGTGTQSAIGTIGVKAEDGEEDHGPGEEGGDGSDDEVGDGPAEGEHGEGSLALSGDQLPFGAASPLDLAGRDIAVNDKDGVTVLAGKTPVSIPNEPEHRNGKCDLSRPDPAVDADAEGVLKLESGEGRVVIKVHLENLDPGKVYDLVITKPDDSASETIGQVTINEGGNGHFKLDSEKGDAIPFGAGDLAALKDYKVSVKDETGAAVLVGVICDAQVRPPEDGDGDHGDNDHPKPRCLAATLAGDQEVPPVDTQATGTGEFELGGPDAQKLHYEVKVEGLSGPATGLTINSGAAGATGAVIVELDKTALAGLIDLTPEQSAALRTGDSYVNVQTEAHPDGEIRGQLAACPDDDEGEGDEDGAGDGEGADHGGHASGGGGGGMITAPVTEPMFLMVGDFDTPFLRGDINGDGAVDISDAVKSLDYLFMAGQRPYCLDAADANDDGAVNISDAISEIFYLFLAGHDLPAPGTFIPGSDPTPDSLYCQETP